MSRFSKTFLFLIGSSLIMTSQKSNAEEKPHLFITKKYSTSMTVNYAKNQDSSVEVREGEKIAFDTAVGANEKQSQDVVIRDSVQFSLRADKVKANELSLKLVASADTVVSTAEIKDHVVGKITSLETEFKLEKGRNYYLAAGRKNNEQQVAPVSGYTVFYVLRWN